MKKQTFRRIIGCMRGTRFLYVFGVLGMAGLTFLFQTQIALMFLTLFDTIMSGTFTDVLDNVLMNLIVVLFIFMMIPPFIYITQKAVVKTTGNIRRFAFSKLARLPVTYFKKHHSAEITSRLTNDITEVEKAYSNLLLNFIVNLIAGLGTSIVMFFLDWRLSVIGLFAAVLTVLVNTVYAKRLRRVSTKVQENLSTLNTKLSNIISGLQVVRVFNIQRLIMEKFNKSNTDVQDVSQERVRKQAVINAANTFIGFMSFIGITTIGAYFVLIGETTVGTIVAVTQLQNGIRELARSLGDFITNLQASLAAGDRVFELFDESEEVEYYPQENLELENTSVAFKNLSFAYDDDPVIKNMTFSLENNQTAALVGPSGGGKSTVFKLLMQFYPPQEGALLVGNKGAAKQSLKEIRNQIAYVPQDAHLFNCSVKENIAYGNLEASEEKIIEAAKAANAHDFIMSLPEEYDTQVGENGTSLSGGQRQRIAIARAILKDAPILLLDEATSALDNESEKLVQEALANMMQDKSSLVIAHRLSTIEHTDNIFVIENGEVVETGAHQVLLDQEGLYANLYEKQLRNGT